MANLIPNSFILKKAYRFIRDDVQLVAWVDKRTGKQKLIIQQIDLDSKKILQQNYIDCIHTAVCDIPINEFSDTITDEKFEDRMLKIRSSENLQIINLTPEEKFKAFKSWVAGIAEAGRNAFSIQAEIDVAANIMYPIIGQLLKFMASIDEEIAFEYISNIEKQSMYQGIKHESFLIANLIPLLDMIRMDGIERFENDIEALFTYHSNLIEYIFQLKPPLKLFSENNRFMKFLMHEKAVELEDFKTLFKHENVNVRLSISKNPRITEFDEFTFLLNNKFEKDFRVRLNAASHPNAIKFLEFRNLFYSYIEENPLVRQILARRNDVITFPEYDYFFFNDLEENPAVRTAVAENESATKHPLYVRFLNPDLESNESVRRAVAANPKAVNFEEYKKFLSYKTCPSRNVRINVAKNPNISKFKGFKNFLSIKSEPDDYVRARIASRRDATKFEEFKNFLDYRTEPAGIVRFFAASNENAVKFQQYRNFLDVKTEPYVNVRRAAAINPYAINFNEFENFFFKEKEPDLEVRRRAVSNPRAVNLDTYWNIINREIKVDIRVLDAAWMNKNRKNRI